MCTNRSTAPYQWPQLSSASRFTAGAFGFLTFTQCGTRRRLCCYEPEAEHGYRVRAIVRSSGRCTRRPHRFDNPADAVNGTRHVWGDEGKAVGGPLRPTALLLLIQHGGSFSDVDFSKSESFYNRAAYWPSFIQHLIQLAESTAWPRCPLYPQKQTLVG